jgi:hypothetical protein
LDEGDPTIIQGIEGKTENDFAHKHDSLGSRAITNTHTSPRAHAVTARVILDIPIAKNTGGINIVTQYDRSKRLQIAESTSTVRSNPIHRLFMPNQNKYHEEATHDQARKNECASPAIVSGSSRDTKT